MDQTFCLPARIDIQSVSGLLSALIKRMAPNADLRIETDQVTDAGLPLLQLLIAAHRSAEASGQRLEITVPNEGVVALLMQRFGLSGDAGPAIIADGLWTGLNHACERI